VLASSDTFIFSLPLLNDDQVVSRIKSKIMIGDLFDCYDEVIEGEISNQVELFYAS
jgi:hypothetical protein